MPREPYLESAVMEILWTSESPMTPAQVHAELVKARPIAYTTVLTAMSRLWKKGLLERERQDRTFIYVPREGKADSAARRMEELLAATQERSLTLARFLNNLSASDRKELLGFLEGE